MFSSFFTLRTVELMFLCFIGVEKVFAFSKEKFKKQKFLFKL